MLGDADTGYDYNSLLYQEDLSPQALYGKYVVIGLAGLALLYIMWDGKKKRH